MKQDLDLIRKILFELEGKDLEDHTYGRYLNIPGASADEVVYQLLLLNDAGYISAKADARGPAPTDILVFRMTWAGHEFLEAARDEKRWAKAQEAASKTGAFALDVFKAVLIELAKQAMRSATGLSPQ